MEVFYLYAVDLAGEMIGQIRNQRLNPAINLVQEGPGGHVDNEYAAIAGGQPAMGFTSSAVAKALDECGWNGTPISATPFNAWWQKGLEGGLRDTSGHVLMQVVKGMLYPMTIRAPHVPPATIDYNLLASYNSADLPIQISTGALTDAPAADEMFCAGPVVIGAWEFEGVQDVTINFGITPEVQSHKGITWPIYIGIRNRLPQIVVRFLDSSYISNIDLDGFSGACTVYLRKVLEGGTRVPDATAEHISCSIAKSIVTMGDSSAANPNTADNTVTITPLYTPGVSPVDSMIFDTSVALP